MSNITPLLKNNSEHYEVLVMAGEIAAEEKLPCYLVGGYVRDKLLNRETTDVDIMVEGDAISYAKKLSAAMGIGKVVEFKEFGTARIPNEGFEIEVASARSESYRKDSRNPKIEFSTFKDDMSRRDFTINAIAASIHPESFGKLHDPFGGIKDLHKGLIITPLDPDSTFDDDPLRMLRAIRFSAQLKFDIAPNILESISRMKDRIKIIPWERITNEIIKILKADTPSIGFYTLRDTGLINIILPEFSIMGGIETIQNMSHKDVFIHTLQVIDNAAALTDKMEIRFAALVHDIAKPQTKKFINGKGWTYYGHEIVGINLMKKLAKRMKLSNELRDYLCKLIKLHLRPIALAKKGVTDSAVRRVMVAAGEDIDDLMILCRADITTKNPKKVKRYLNNFERVEEMVQNVKLRDEMKAFQSPIRGAEIMEIFNLKPGRDVGKIKTAIEEAILDGDIENNYEAAYEFMMNLKKDIT
tara:strand:- start:1431 stop:2843 length:1413 start_codon:yes stop_codon:yes gene_type:complete